MDKLISTIKLLAKSGLFFANCDGEVSDRERKYINTFLGNILEVGDIDDELKNEVEDSLNHTYTLEGIIDETKQLVDGFNEDERKAILFMLNHFIHKVVSADERVDSRERDNYAKWQQAFGM